MSIHTIWIRITIITIGHYPWWYDDDYYYDGSWYAENPYDYAEIERQRAIVSIREQIAAAQGVLDRPYLARKCWKRIARRPRRG